MLNKLKGWKTIIVSFIPPIVATLAQFGVVLDETALTDFVTRFWVQLTWLVPLVFGGMRMVTDTKATLRGWLENIKKQ